MITRLAVHTESKRVAAYDPGNAPWFMFVDKGQFLGWEKVTEAHGWRVIDLEDLAPPKLLMIVWRWIIDANNGNCADSGDLIVALERAGFRCPPELEDEL